MGVLGEFENGSLDLPPAFGFEGMIHPIRHLQPVQALV
jgi:hypothetical protein